MNNAPYFSEQALEAIARLALLKFDPQYMNRKPGAIPIEYIIEEVYGMTLDFRKLTVDNRLLGKTIFDDGVTPYYDLDTNRYEVIYVKAGTMMLETFLADEGNLGRLRFTEAHELAHWLIHQQYYKGTGKPAAFLSSDQDNITERQANVVASALLMPKGLVRKGFFSFRNLGPEKALAETAAMFEVSKEAMKYRLQGFGLL